MKKVKKALKIIITTVIAVAVIFQLFLLCISLVGARKIQMHPISQPGTVWQNEENTMSFTVTAGTYEGFHMTIERDSEISEIILFLDLKNRVLFLPSNSLLSNDNYLAIGFGKVKDYDEYIITITSAEHLFKEGEEILFKRIETPSDSRDGSPRIRPIKQK